MCPKLVSKPESSMGKCTFCKGHHKANTSKISTDINFQGLSDCENSTTRTTPTSAFALFYSARSHEQLDLIYLSPFAKVQNPPEVKVSELFHSKGGDFPLANLPGNRPNLHWSGPPTPIPCVSITFYGSAALVFV